MYEKFFGNPGEEDHRIQITKDLKVSQSYEMVMSSDKYNT